MDTAEWIDEITAARLLGVTAPAAGGFGLLRNTVSSATVTRPSLSVSMAVKPASWLP